MIRNHDRAPEVLLAHLKSYQQDTVTWDLRLALNAAPVAGTDHYWEAPNIVLRYQFTEKGERYYVGRDRRRSLVCWGTQPEELAASPDEGTK